MRLAREPLPYAAAPKSSIFGGPGGRQGLFLTPVAGRINPGGFVLVLEQGNSRIQAFDTSGNSVSLFNGLPFWELPAAADARYQDLAMLDVLAADGTLLCRAEGVGARRIAVDSRDAVFTLDNATVIGRNKSPEPSISVWTPSASS